MDKPHTFTKDEDDGVVDSIAAVVLTLVFIAVCIFWVSGQ